MKLMCSTQFLTHGRQRRKRLTGGEETYTKNEAEGLLAEDKNPNEVIVKVEQYEPEGEREEKLGPGGDADEERHVLSRG
jgi:hypothetical protein